MARYLCFPLSLKPFRNAVSLFALISHIQLFHSKTSPRLVVAILML